LAAYADFLASREGLPRALARVRLYVAALPSDAAGYLVLGSLQQRMESAEQARASYQKAVTLEPGSIEGYLRLGKLEQQQRNITQAINFYQQALRGEPDFTPLHTLIGNLYLELGDLGNAKKYYQQALTIDPNAALAAANLAWVYTLEKDANLDEALTLAQRARSLQPDLPPVSDTLAWVEYKKGSYAAAVPLLRECVARQPQSALYHYHLGLALMANGGKREGSEQLRAALRLNLGAGDAEQARRALAEN
jgi:tetratricopeptide (TPR) repeat protein